VELSNAEARVFDDSTHGISVDGVVTGNCYEALTVRHYDVFFPLAHNLESGFFQSSYGMQMLDTGKLGISNSHSDFAYVRILDGIIHGGKVLLDGIFDVFDSLGLCITLRPASGQRRTSDAVPSIALMQDNFVFH
jgi:hypothetical protein